MTVNDMMALSATVGILMLGATHADAQGACAAQDQIAAQLGATYGETRQSLGLSSDGSVIEIFASDAGTWTIVVTSVDGQACLAAAGEAWQAAPVTVKGQPA
jgi:hypothetical protein